METRRIADLYWLPLPDGVADELRRVATEKQVDWKTLVQLAGNRLDFVQTNRLDKILQRTVSGSGADAATISRLNLAVLSASTADHLLPGMRIAALRRGISLRTYLGDYGQYRQELLQSDSGLFKFAPDVVLFAFNAQHLLGSPNPAMDENAADALVESAAQQVRGIWQLAREKLSGQLLQQTVLPIFPRLAGQNEARLAGSMANLVSRLNRRLVELAPEQRVDILDLDWVTARDGLSAWHDPMLWHRSKQEISPVAAPAYGDLAVRMIAAQRGRSFKCMVLDLDNTLWGGVIGDDGLEGIRLGQGSAAGEAFVAFQNFARDMSRRGIILAVCSKNDPENARSPFEKHPDMVLKMTDIACFVANWSDKAGNLRAIAEQLNIGVDSLVFVDDNPFERNIVRRELPMVAVPELPEDVAYYADAVADAGYFEALKVTREDFERGGQYQANLARETLRASHTDLDGYLRTLNMELRWQPFDSVGLQRIVQLINKTNQFNLTTRRYTENEVIEVMGTPGALTLQLRLLDHFGDNGIIGIVIGKPEPGEALRLDTWLMSCRVLGRQVEEATMNLVADQAIRLGAKSLLGEYLPTQKNGMVKDHYRKLGFEEIDNGPAGASRWRADLAAYVPFPTFIKTVRS
jgi:FkbH-like protein